MSDDTVISMEEWRRRRFAAPPSATPVLTGATRRRLKALQAEQSLGADAVGAWYREAQRALFASHVLRGIAFTVLWLLGLWGAVALLAVTAWRLP